MHGSRAVYAQSHTLSLTRLVHTTAPNLNISRSSSPRHAHSLIIHV